MRRSTRTSVGVIAAMATALAVALLPGASQAQTPLYFPRTQTLDTTAYTLRVAGTDRYATAGALARVAADNQRINTGFPFNEADATTPTKAYGFGTCPRSVAIAAGDTVADALSASAVKDLGLLTLGSPGEQVDTTGINLLLTVSARQGGFSADLAKETLSSLSDLRSACGSFDIIVFGGETAVPAPAFRALEAIGETTVRVLGADRFDTAAKVARAISGVKGPTTVPLFTDPLEPTNLPNAVFLAEGFTGADALAVGPYLSNKNVPVLLTESNKLPEATRNALLTLRPQNIIVLGGPAAVSDATVVAAKRAAGIAPPPEGEDELITRIAGEDRYQTSIEIARQLFNVQPCCDDSIDPFGILIPPTTVSFSNQFMSFARSEGAGATHAGFPDALSSAYFLDSASDIAVPPIRRAPPIEENTAPQNEDGTFGQKVTIGGSAGPRRAPLLLLPQGAIPETTTAYLESIFNEEGRTASDPEAENHGGFGFVFGGEAAVSRASELAVAQLLSGGTYTPDEEGAPGPRTDLAPAMTPTSIFYTDMSFDGYTTPNGRGVNSRAAVGAGDKVCATGGALKGAQWLAAYEAGAFSTAQDVDYVDSVSRFFCMDAEPVDSDRAQVLGFSLSGHETPPISVDWSGGRLKVDPPATDDRSDSVTDGGNLTTEGDSLDPLGLIAGPETRRSSATFSGTTDIQYKNTTYSDAAWTLTLNFVRTDPNGSPPDDTVTFTGTFTVRSGASVLFSASVAGESVGNESPYKLVGSYNLGSGKGGFRATVSTPADDNFVLTDLVLDGTA